MWHREFPMYCGVDKPDPLSITTPLKHQIVIPKPGFAG